jgi:CRP-like cAMP-binding protein
MTHEDLDLLKGLMPDDAEAILGLGIRMSVGGGAELFQLGAPAENLYLVERGRIRLSLPMRVRGKEEDILVEEVGPGQMVGWSALIPPYRLTLKATALLDTELLAFPRDILRDHFASNPRAGSAVALNLATVIGQRLQRFQAMWLREMQRTVELQYR